jgi:ubiquinone/menaquinone biosynthesis C-methylase UbiE
VIEYGQLARYYDLFQRQLVDYAAEAKTMHELFCEHDVRTVLDLACGTGAHVLELTKLGYQCVGADSSSEMVAVAREKAQMQGLEIEFVMGDLLDYQLDRTFDAVLGVYAFATLVSDEQFRAGLASARRAVREGGLFYLNLFNAASEGIAQLGMGPGFYLDVVVNEPDIRLVRFNQVAFRDDVQTWIATYLIDEGNGVNMITGSDRLRFFHLQWAQQELRRAGFQFLSVTYAGVEGVADWDMFILAQVNGTLETTQPQTG